MAGNLPFLKIFTKRFLQEKKVWVFLLLILVAILVFFLFFQSQSSNDDLRRAQEASLGSIADDIDPPTVLIESPKEQTWQSTNFVISVFQEDLENGIDENSCFFQVCSYDVSEKENCTGLMQRVCNAIDSIITVGNEAMCPFEGRDACVVFVGAKDGAGNEGEISASFHIDLTLPYVGKLLAQEQDGQYLFSVDTKDNVGIRACGLYLNERFIQFMDMEEDCQEQCTAKTLFQSTVEESRRFFARCSDYAGNTTDGEAVLFTLNHEPIISSCRVFPVQGARETEFRFFVEAKDPDEDLLFYSWEFGDGNTGKDSQVVHSYLSPGTYMPRVQVADSKGEIVECSTAWVVVE